MFLKLLSSHQLKKLKKKDEEKHFVDLDGTSSPFVF